MTATKKIMFLACGSFNPPTPMHLRLFEIARDEYSDSEYEVIGGIISPVHDSYLKPDLASALHRCAMVKISLRTSDWIRLSDWECTNQSDWTRTRVSLQYHQNYINSILNGETTKQTVPSWIPPNIHKYKGERIQIKLLCGGDLLESFATPKLWNDNDIEVILSEDGIVVCRRFGTNPEQFIFNSDLLTKFRKFIKIVTNWVPNEVSSTLARRFLRRGLSVKYMLDDNIAEYIRQNNLYDVDASKYIITPTQTNKTMARSLSPNYIKDSYIRQADLNNYNYETMDETDCSTEQLSTRCENGESSHVDGNDHSKLLCSSSKSSRLNRPGQAIQIRDGVNGTRTIDHEDEVQRKKFKPSSACDS